MKIQLSILEDLNVSYSIRILNDIFLLKEKFAVCLLEGEALDPSLNLVQRSSTVSSPAWSEVRRSSWVGHCGSEIMRNLLSHKHCLLVFNSS